MRRDLVKCLPSKARGCARRIHRFDSPVQKGEVLSSVGSWVTTTNFLVGHLLGSIFGTTMGS